MHHRFFTLHPDLWTEFCEERSPGIWDRLNMKVAKGTKALDAYRHWISFYESA